MIATQTDRRALARGRVPAARAALADCQLCAHNCRVNRLAGERGVCRAGANARVICAQLEVADELELIPTFAIALSGCDLRCEFCITGRESWDPRAGDVLNLAFQTEGARSIMILGGEPTIHLPAVLEIVAALPEGVPLVWKTNAHGSAQARAWLAGLFDVWVADYKFGNDECARRLARVTGYNAVVQENLRWAHAECKLIVRHLVMPGHVECCWFPIAGWLAENLPGVTVSLRDGFWPAWQTSMRRSTTTSEFARARTIAEEYGLKLAA